MNELKQIEKFRAVLNNYTPSETAKKALEKIELVLLVGPTSSGRNTIMNELVKTGDYHIVVSDTTRQPRINNGIPEQNGREYWFRTEEDILADLEAGNFLEAAIIHNQQVSGISVRELQSAADEHKIAINEIEVVGADNIHAASPEAKFLFVIPPSFEEWMARMTSRGALPEDEVARRLGSAVSELETALGRNYYIFVVNDTFQLSAQRVNAIIKQNKVEPEEQLRSKAIAQELLERTKQHVAQLV